MKTKIPKLTEEEKAAGGEIFEVSDNDLVVEDISDKRIENMARGFIMGTQAIGRRKQVREALEERVVKRIGQKGKMLTDRLFELIDGVYTVQKDDKNGIRYYRVPPNLNAIIYALDRVLGKPKQYTEVSQESKGIILVEHVIKNLATNPYARNEDRSSVGGNVSGRIGTAGEVRQTDGQPAGSNERVAEGTGTSVVQG